MGMRMELSTASYIAGGLAVVVAGWNVYLAILSQQNQRATDQKAAAAQKELLDATKATSAAQEKLQKATEENLRLTKEAQAITTGGDGFCYFWVAFDGENIALEPTNDGPYPQWNVTAHVTDLNEVDRQNAEAARTGRPTSIVEASRARRNQTIGNMPAQTSANSAIEPMYPLRWPMTGITDRAFLVEIVAMNGSVMQQIRVHVDPATSTKAASMRQAWIVKRGDKVLKERDLDWLPKLPDGTPDFNLPRENAPAKP